MMGNNSIHGVDTNLRPCALAIIMFVACIGGLPASRLLQAQSPLSSDETAALQMTPQDQRRAANADYVNVPVRTRVAQRFEMYNPHSDFQSSLSS